MKLAEFDYVLPDELIAQQPLPERTASRLLRVGDAQIDDLEFREVGSLLRPGDVLVLNDTRVIPARLFGRKASGGRIEMLLERVIEENRALVQLRSSHPPKLASGIQFDGGGEAVIVERREPFFLLRFSEPVLDLLNRSGHVPLPPYIRREDVAGDRERYQTVFAREPGAVAAPTAGLHFDAALLDTIRQIGVITMTVTLHVGAGTFQPVREAQLAAGRLHSELVAVTAPVCQTIVAARASGGRVVAVGTTVVRALETAARSGDIAPFQGETDLFIMPGYRFRVVDAMITNFHLPQSSLLMLVCAFGGTERVLAAYRHAVAHRYRFYSYGDVMFVEKNRDLSRPLSARL